MPNLHELIAQIQRDLYCPVCGKNYEIGEIRVKGLFDHTLIIQTICESGHITLFMTSFKAKAEKDHPLTTNDVLDMTNAIEKFDGDFTALWKK